jgi:hypothetical protein
MVGGEKETLDGFNLAIGLKIKLILNKIDPLFHFKCMGATTFQVSGIPT